MKKIIMIVLVLVSVGCSLYDYGMDYYFMQKIQKTDIYYHEDFNELHTIDDIRTYLNDKIKYRSDKTEYWSTTKETLTKGYGDCEDYAIAFMNIYYVVFNEKCDLAAVHTKQRTVVQGGFVNHALILLPNDILISPRSNMKVHEEIKFIYQFDLFFK